MGKTKSGEYEVEAVVGRRVEGGKIMYLIKWSGYEERTWEARTNCNCYKLIDEFENSAAKTPSQSVASSSRETRRSKPVADTGPKTTSSIQPPVKKSRSSVSSSAKPAGSEASPIPDGRRAVSRTPVAARSTSRTTRTSERAASGLRRATFTRSATPSPSGTPSPVKKRSKKNDKSKSSLNDLLADLVATKPLVIPITFPLRKSGKTEEVGGDFSSQLQREGVCILSEEDLGDMPVWSVQSHADWEQEKGVVDEPEHFCGRPVNRVVAYVPAGESFCLVHTTPGRREKGGVALRDLVHAVRFDLAAKAFPQAFSDFAAKLALIGQNCGSTATTPKDSGRKKKSDVTVEEEEEEEEEMPGPSTSTGRRTRSSM